MSVQLDPTYRLVHVASNPKVPIADIIDAVHRLIGKKFVSGNNTIESIRKDESGHVFLIRRPDHADKLLMKGRLLINSEKLSVDSVVPGSHRLEVNNLPLFVTEEDVRKLLMKFGTVRFVKSGLVVNDIRDGTFTTCIIVKNNVPKRLCVTSCGKKHSGDVNIISKVPKNEKCCILCCF